MSALLLLACLGIAFNMNIALQALIRRFVFKKYMSKILLLDGTMDDILLSINDPNELFVTIKELGKTHRFTIKQIHKLDAYFKNIYKYDVNRVENRMLVDIQRYTKYSLALRCAGIDNAKLISEKNVERLLTD